MQCCYLIVRCNGQSAFFLSLKACSKVHSAFYTDVYLNDDGLDGIENSICGMASSKDELALLLRVASKCIAQFIVI